MSDRTAEIERLRSDLKVADKLHVLEYAEIERLNAREKQYLISHREDGKEIERLKARGTHGFDQGMEQAAKIAEKMQGIDAYYLGDIAAVIRDESKREDSDE